jgi:hypothetical protein
MVDTPAVAPTMAQVKNSSGKTTPPASAPAAPVLPALVSLNDWADYKAQHNLTVLAIVWPHGSPHPLAIVKGK